MPDETPEAKPRSKGKSPTYPTLSLPEAIEKIRSLYSQYLHTPADRLIAVRLFGFPCSGGEITGGATMALSAIIQYGLLESADTGRVRVTEFAGDLLDALDSNDDRSLKLLEEAAGRPPLFRDLMERFKGLASPPESGVRSQLARCGFIPSTLPVATKNFLSTIKCLEEARRKSGMVVAEHDVERTDQRSAVQSTSQAHNVLNFPENKNHTTSQTKGKTWPFPLMKGEGALVLPETLCAEDGDIIKMSVEQIVSVLLRRKKEDTSENSSKNEPEPPEPLDLSA